MDICNLYFSLWIFKYDRGGHIMAGNTPYVYHHCACGCGEITKIKNNYTPECYKQILLKEIEDDKRRKNI